MLPIFDGVRDVTMLSTTPPDTKKPIFGAPNRR